MSGIIANAISHLKELEENMRLEGVNFSIEDIENCDNVADLLQELETSVKKVHEDLETETIKTSIYRHKLNAFNTDLKQEIDDNVKAARDSNSHVITDLKDKLDTISKNMVVLHEKDKDLSANLEKLKPEKLTLAKTHQSIIYDLNKKMSQKAAAQIQVNETKDELEGVNEKTRQIEEEIIALKEQVVKEKAVAREQRDSLVKEKIETLNLARDQEAANSSKAKELDIVQSNLKETEKVLRLVFRENEKLTGIMNELDAEANKEENDFNDQTTRLNNQIAEGIRLRNLDTDTEKNYHQTKADTIQNTKDTGERTKVEIENVKELKEEAELKKIGVKEVHGVLKAVQVTIEESKEITKKLQKEVSDKLQEIVELEAKSEACYAQLGEAQESHNQVMDSLMRESEEYREQLSHEKELKLKNQHLRDSNFLEIVAFNETATQQQQVANKYLGHGRQKFETLTEREAYCTERIQFNEIEKTRLEVELKTANDNYKIMKENTAYKIQKLETEIAHYKNEDNKLVKEIEGLEPAYAELCKVHDQKLKEFNRAKTDLIKSKTLKKNMEENIEKTNSKITLHSESMTSNKEETLAKRKEKLATLKTQSNNLKKLENQILETGLKAYTIKEQNDKFIQAIKDFEVEYGNLDKEKVEVLKGKEEIEDEYENIHIQLLEGWQADQDLEEIFVKEDRDLVNKLAIVLKKAKKRESDVVGVADKLYQEIDTQSKYIDSLIGKVEESQMFNHNVPVDA